MQPQSVMEMIEAERMVRLLRLQTDVQLDNLVGAWERMENEDHFFWSDPMFSLHELPLQDNNLISIDDANAFIHPDDVRMVLAKREELEHTGYVDFRLRLQLAQGKIKYIHAREKKVLENDTVIYRGNWQDEIKRKEFQQPVIDKNEALSLKLRVFERAEEVASTGSWQINLETFETIYSDNVYRIYGLSPQSIPPHVDTFRKFIHPDDRAVVLKSWEKAYVEMIPLHLEYRIVRNDGETRYISQASYLMKNGRGEHILSGSVRDITEQKLLEIRLREANEILTLHNELFIQSEQISQLGTWQVNVNTRKTVYSSNLFRLYGLKPFSISPGIDSFIQFVHPDDRGRVLDAYNKAFEQHTAPELEFRINRADGKQRTLRQKSRFIKAEGEELLIGIVQDVTDQQQKDRLLREANEKLAVQNEAFRQAEKMAGIGNWTWNINTNEIFYSDNIYNIYGLKPQSVPPGFSSFGKYMHPEDRKWLKGMPEKILSEMQPMTIEYRIIRADGEMRYLRAKNQPITTPAGDTVIIGVTQDVTHEVQLHRELLEKIKFAELLSDTIADRIFVTDTANNIISWNKSCENIYKHKKENVLGCNFFDVVPQLRVPQVMERFKKALSGDAVHVPVMPSLQTFGDFEEIFAVPLKNDDGRVIGVLHVMHDVTQQQHLQEELSARLLFIEKLMEASVDRIIALDKNLNLQLWNKPCEKHYGRSQEQVIGKHISEVFPQFKAEGLYHQCVLALEGQTVHMPANESAGVGNYHESYFVPLKNEVKEVTGLLWIMHDLTERFIAEQRLRTSETHLKEAQSIAMMGSFEMDIPGDKINCSDQTYSIFEYPRGTEVFVKDMMDARIHPEDRGAAQALMQKLQGGWREPVDIHFRIVTPHQEIRHIYMRAQVMFNAKDIPVKIQGVVQDITERKLAEEALRESQRFGREVADSAPDLIYVLDIVEKKILFINGRVLELLGHEAEHVYRSGQAIFRQVLHPADFEKRMHHIASLANLGENETREIDVRLKGADGSWRWFKIRDRVFKRTGNGMVWQTIGAAQDITEKKNAEAQILKQRELLQQAEEIAHIGSWELEAGTNKLVWSDEIFRIYGYAPQIFEPALEFYLETIHPDDRIALRAALDQAFSSGKSYMLTCRLFTLDAELRYIHTRGKVVRSSSGEVARIVGTMQDITPQKIMETELRRRNQAMRNQFQVDRLTEKLRNIGSWQLNIQTGRLLWTEKMFQLFGLKLYSFEPSIESFRELVHPADRQQVDTAIEHMKVMPPGLLPDFEFTVIVGNQPKYFRVSSRKVDNRNIVGTTMDITQDALLRKELSEKIKLLEEKNEDLSSFAFVASHDLREPLRKIQIFSDWLCQREAEKLSPEGIDRFTRIQKAVERMETLIDDILNYSHISIAGRIKEQIELNNILDNAMADLREIICDTGAIIEAGPLPAIMGNSSQFAQVFRNLIGNALKYHKPGMAPHIRITSQEAEGRELMVAGADHGTRYIKLSFQDNGIGFDQAYAKKIFQMFQRLHGVHEYPGTGMGLAICKKILEYHGGAIVASGKEGEGAVFDCYIPVSENNAGTSHAVAES